MAARGGAERGGPYRLRVGAGHQQNQTDVADGQPEAGASERASHAVISPTFPSARGAPGTTGNKTSRAAPD